MRGYGGGQAASGQVSEKWMLLNQIMREKKIAVLAVQEAHLDEERAGVLKRVFEETIEIVYSPDPDNRTAARGVAFVINKRIVKQPKYEYRVVREGRVLLLDLEWSPTKRLRILNVYAPNDMTRNAEMWDALTTANIGRVDIALGDMNVVEDPMDRLPPREDHEGARTALRRWMATRNLVDGWRRSNVDVKAYSYMHANNGHQSRLDRIYIKPRLEKDADNWEMGEPGIRTDHKLVWVDITDRESPFVGKGRWAMPKHLLKDDKMKKAMRQLAKRMVSEMEIMGERTAERNAQTIYCTFKTELVAAARVRAKEKIPKMQKRIEKLRSDLHATLNPVRQPACEAEEDAERKIAHAAILQERLERLEQKRFESTQRMTAARHNITNETLTKRWTRAAGTTTMTVLCAESIRELRDPEASDGRPTHTNHTKRMAEIAKSHYDGVQRVDPVDPSRDREKDIQDALEAMSAKLTNREKSMMAKKLMSGEVAEAIKTAASDKSPGLDGLQTEVWKEYVRWYEHDVKAGKGGIDVAKALANVYNDIVRYGVQEGTDFAVGWICPVYKLKKDKQDIENYRPITLLNSDYKIMTRALATKLADCVSGIIHEDQAGFIPGRSIFSHIKLARTMIEYAEAEEINGAIVALDQEKAYDRIDHDYLWEALRRANFPETFIKTMRNLYTNAESCVIINGIVSSRYLITRGVRQGDLISCLLFDVAIEPLVEALRKSTLRGFNLPGTNERLIAKLFADDTTVFLSEDDDYRVMEEVTSKWCVGSRAKFNLAKTEIIPVGSKEHRDRVRRERRIGRVGGSVTDGAHITEEGEAVRILGAWVGNKIDECAVWSRIVNTVRTNLEKWAKRSPTLNGKHLIVGMEVGGRTQFLAKAQGMPEKVEQSLNRIVQAFIWGEGKKPKVARDTLWGELEDGGIKLLDLSARNEAIELVWLKSYLDFTEKHQTWTLLADTLMAKAVAAESKKC
ncbi:hypothetical protein ONZ51_g12888 [Trametes cubensis]|uniref:Reverse transcriptase domain-containing protein n=1 Tax=Trametes cubensis TaxID=1111947 RepID=A0AAD7X3C6_9APHY|nr:hypothetical protein ONZ51_g12888 [Trametes cubensis]